jgi:hypothetical protein
MFFGECFKIGERFLYVWGALGCRLLGLSSLSVSEMLDLVEFFTVEVNDEPIVWSKPNERFVPRSSFVSGVENLYLRTVTPVCCIEAGA